jgi:uncharacterized protein (TIGR02145 family)
MKTTSPLLLFILCILTLSLTHCKPEAKTGEITGEVVDLNTYLPIADAIVVLNPGNDTAKTGSDGKFKYQNISPGTYYVQVSKPAYKKETKNAPVVPSKATTFYFALNGAAVAKFSSKNLDFGLDSTVKIFTISNVGKATLTYSINTNKPWITVFPFSGSVNSETDTIRVTINKTEISNDLQKGAFSVTSEGGDDIPVETVGVYVNGVLDADLNYYKVVKIGTQTWMGENLNTGVAIPSTVDQTVSPTIKKYGYADDDRNCQVFGGLYQWSAMMQGSPSDSGAIGTTRGICPVGWHVPTKKEWEYLCGYLGESVASVKLKEAGTTHWQAGNVATNESGFTALPGGMYDGQFFSTMTSHAFIWTATTEKNTGWYYSTQFEYNSEKVIFPKYHWREAAAIRCIMDQAK